MMKLLFLMCLSLTSTSNIKERSVFRVGEPIFRATAILHLTAVIKLPDVQSYCTNLNNTIIGYLQTFTADDTYARHTLHLSKRNLELICQSSHRWDSPVVARPKRQAALFLGGAALVTSLFSFAWTNSKINKAMADINSLETKFHKTLLILEQDHIAINHINRRINEHAKVLQIMVHLEQQTASRTTVLERISSINEAIRLLQLEAGPS